MKKAAMRRRLFLSDRSLLPSERTTLMVEQHKARAIPRSVQNWIARNLPIIQCGTKLEFTKPIHTNPNYVGDLWHVMVNVRQLAGFVRYKPSAYPKSVRTFVRSLPANESTWLVVRKGHVGTEMENWRGFAPKDESHDDEKHRSGKGIDIETVAARCAGDCRTGAT